MYSTCPIWGTRHIINFVEHPKLPIFGIVNSKSLRPYPRLSYPSGIAPPSEPGAVTLLRVALLASSTDPTNVARILCKLSLPRRLEPVERAIIVDCDPTLPGENNNPGLTLRYIAMPFCLSPKASTTS